MTGSSRVRRSHGLRRAATTLVPAALVPLTAFAVLPPALAALTGLLRIETCVPAGGVVGWAGLHLALVHPASACPNGELALGGSSDRALAVMVTMTLPPLLAHLAALLSVAGVVAVARTVADGVGALARRARLPGAAGADIPPTVRVRPVPVEPFVVVTGLLRPLPRRGPPGVLVLA